MKKIKEYLKNMNPYLLASALIVALSVGMIIALLQDMPAEGSDPDVTPGVMENASETQETEPQDTEAFEESWEMDDVETENKEKEESENETMETAGKGAESASESSSEPQQVSKPEESCEPVKEPDGEVEPEEVPETTEEMIPEEPHEEEPEDSKEPTATDSEDVVNTEPEETPESSEVPGAEVHQHCWLFESYYQKPTCSNGGLVTQICAHCGENQITGGTPTGEHFYEVETPGDCSSAEVVVCTECNYREVREKDPTNHIDVEDGFCYGCGHKAE